MPQCRSCEAEIDRLVEIWTGRVEESCEFKADVDRVAVRGERDHDYLPDEQSNYTYHCPNCKALICHSETEAIDFLLGPTPIESPAPVVLLVRG